jgi:RNase H-fold protein (predicted Holliday junction resolvase)
VIGRIGAVDYGRRRIGLAVCDPLGITVTGLDTVVVPGSRPAPGSWARVRGLSISSAVIVKYRDGRTDARTALESSLR